MSSIETLFFTPKHSMITPYQQLKNDPDINLILSQAVGKPTFQSAKEVDIEVLEILQEYGSAPVSMIPRETFSSLDEWKESSIRESKRYNSNDVLMKSK